MTKRNIRYIIGVLLFFCFGCNSNSQQPAVKSPNQDNKKQWVWPKPLRDSVWTSVTCDTLFGKIQIVVGSGRIVGNGYVTTCLYFHSSKWVYSKKNQASIDSFHNVNQIFGGYVGMAIGSVKTAYIKTKNGYKEVEGTFTLIPD